MAIAKAEANEAFTLAWVRHKSALQCPNQAELRKRVAKRLGRDPFGAEGDHHIEGSVRQKKDRLVAELTVRDSSGRPKGTRALDSDELDCRALIDAVTLAVSLAVDPQAALAPSRAKKKPIGPLPPPPMPSKQADAAKVERKTIVVPVPVFAEAPEPKAHLVAGGLSFAVNAGSLPRVAAGLGLKVQTELSDPWLAAINATTFPEVRTDSAESAFGLSHLSPLGCVRFLKRSRSWLALCAGPELGIIHSVVFSNNPKDPGDRFWLAARAELNLSLEVTEGWLVELGGATGVPLIRHEFVVAGQPGNVFEPSSVNATALFGLQFGHW